MTLTKGSVNYKTPQAPCCGYCMHSYSNTYGDACCKLLNAADLIEFGAVCDMYNIINEETERMDFNG